MKVDLLGMNPDEYIKHLNQLSDRVLRFDHALMHAYWNMLKRGEKDRIPEPYRAPEVLKKVHDAIVAEMKKRGMMHTSELAMQKPYAPVHTIRSQPLGKPVSLEEILRHYEKPILLKKGFIRLVGGVVERGSTDGDIDVLIGWPSSTPDEVIHPVKFRIGRALPPELAARLQFLTDDYHGPFTSYVDLYDLALIPSGREIVHMSVGLQLQRLWRPKKGEKPSKYTDVQLMLAHSWVHWWARGEKSHNPEWTYVELCQFHDAIADELQKRGYIHLSRIPYVTTEIPGIKPLTGETTSYMPDIAGHTPSHRQMTVENPMTYEFRQWIANYARRQNMKIDSILELYGGYGYCTTWYREICKLNPSTHILMEIDPQKVEFLKQHFDSVQVLEGNNIRLLEQIEIPKIDILDVDTNASPVAQLETFLERYMHDKPFFMVGDEPTLQKFKRNHPINFRRRLFILSAPDEPINAGQFLEDYPDILYTYLKTLAAKHGWNFEMWAFGGDIR